MSFRMGPPPRRLFHMETLRIIRERRGGQESKNIHMVGQKKMESGHYISISSTSEHAAVESLQKPSEMVLKLHTTLLVNCERCNAKMELQHLRTHVLSTCENVQPPLHYKVTVQKLWEGASTSQHPWRCKQLAF